MAGFSFDREQAAGWGESESPVDCLIESRRRDGEIGDVLHRLFQFQRAEGL